MKKLTTLLAFLFISLLSYTQVYMHECGYNILGSGIDGCFDIAVDTIGQRTFINGVGDLGNTGLKGGIRHWNLVLVQDSIIYSEAADDTFYTNTFNNMYYTSLKGDMAFFNSDTSQGIVLRSDNLNLQTYNDEDGNNWFINAWGKQSSTNAKSVDIGEWSGEHHTDKTYSYWRNGGIYHGVKFDYQDSTDYKESVVFMHPDGRVVIEYGVDQQTGESPTRLVIDSNGVFIYADTLAIISN